MSEPTTELNCERKPDCGAAHGSGRRLTHKEMAELLAIRIAKITYVGGHEEPQKLIEAEIEKELRRQWAHGMKDACEICDLYVRGGLNVYARNAGNAVKRRIVAALETTVPNDRTERRGTATLENQKPYGTT